MGIRRGSISTPIIADGLVFNMDAANRASYVPDSTTSYNTLNLSLTGSLKNDTSYISPPASASCWSLDGVDDYVLSQGVTLGSSFSMGVWATTKAAASNTILIESPHYFSVGFNGNFILRLTSNTSIAFASYDGQSNGEFDTVSVSALFFNRWYYYFVTCDGSNLTFYRDGVAQGSMTHTKALDDTATGIVLGADIAHTNNDLNGNIANTQIYNRFLSANEVLHNYNALKGRFA